MLPSGRLFPEAGVIGVDAEFGAAGDRSAVCAKAPVKPQSSDKQQVSKTEIFKPDIFTNPKIRAAHSRMDSALHARHRRLIPAPRA
jgi:hypothetical protein